MALGGAFFGTTIALLALTYTQLAPHAVATAPASTITFPPLAARSVVFAQDGTALAALHSEEDRIPVPIDQVPPHVVRTVLDAEDERFLENNGLDARAIVRAARTNLEAGRVVEGGLHHHPAARQARASELDAGPCPKG